MRVLKECPMCGEFHYMDLKGYEEEYNDFMRKHTDNAYGDDDINFYADMEDLKEEMIITEDYVFDELEVLY